jgi:MazG family protein
MQRLIEIMERLRDPEGGCPWDIEQTFETIVPHTLEEAYEVADAIERGHLEDLRSELGDLLFQVVFHAQMAREQGLFDFHDVVEGIADKLVRRHPHVFGDAEVADAEEQTREWEKLKHAERRQRADQEGRAHSILDDVGLAMPATLRACKLQKRAARVGFDWPEIDGIHDKIAEELEEVKVELEQGGDERRIEAEIGDLLFACVNLARRAGVNPETALRRANDKFTTRFQRVEELLRERGLPVEEAGLEVLDSLWEQAKAEEAGGG